MALTTFEDYLKSKGLTLDIIANLADEPNDADGLGADQLKAKFDEAGKIIATYINKTLIPEISSDIDAASQGIASGGGIDGDRLNDGSVPDAKIINLDGAKINDGTLTTEKHAKGSITRELLAEDATTLQTEDFPNKVVPNRALEDKCVTNVKLDDECVTTPKYAKESVTCEKLADDAKSHGIAVTLAAAAWASNEQTVSVTGVTADNNVLVAAAPESRTAWNDAEIYCSAQAAGTLTFKCDTVPTVNITANVAVLV